MQLRQYFLSLPYRERASLALECGTTVGYMEHLTTGFRKPGPELALKISKATFYRVTPHELLPNVYPHPDDALPEQFRSRAAERATRRTQATAQS